MTDPSYSYDWECERLAEHFLGDTGSRRNVRDLAQAIQCAVEAWWPAATAASAYDTLPCDSEPRDPSEALPSNENVVDTPISGEPK